MRHHRTVLVIGITEILIGSVTILFNLITLMLSLNPKSPKVLAFVFAASLGSIVIGIGVLKFKKLAYQLLLYFASVIIMSKLLIFMDVIQLNGSLETTIPGSIKNIISIIYHGFVIVYFSERGIKEIYHN